MNINPDGKVIDDRMIILDEQGFDEANMIVSDEVARRLRESGFIRLYRSYWLKGFWTINSQWQWTPKANFGSIQ